MQSLLSSLVKVCVAWLLLSNWASGACIRLWTCVFPIIWQNCKQIQYYYAAKAKGTETINSFLLYNWKQQVARQMKQEIANLKRKRILSVYQLLNVKWIVSPRNITASCTQTLTATTNTPGCIFHFRILSVHLLTFCSSTKSFLLHGAPVIVCAINNVLRWLSVWIVAECCFAFVYKRISGLAAFLLLWETCDCENTPQLPAHVLPTWHKQGLASSKSHGTHMCTLCGHTRTGWWDTLWAGDGKNNRHLRDNKE